MLFDFLNAIVIIFLLSLNNNNFLSGVILTFFAYKAAFDLIIGSQYFKFKAKQFNQYNEKAIEKLFSKFDVDSRDVIYYLSLTLVLYLQEEKISGLIVILSLCYCQYVVNHINKNVINYKVD